MAFDHSGSKQWNFASSLEVSKLDILDGIVAVLTNEGYLVILTTCQGITLNFPKLCFTVLTQPIVHKNGLQIRPSQMPVEF